MLELNSSKLYGVLTVEAFCVVSCYNVAEVESTSTFAPTDSSRHKSRENDLRQLNPMPMIIFNLMMLAGAYARFHDRTVSIPQGSDIITHSCQHC